ncbi:MAG: hypothetical protein GF320_05550 [Armatimonadia bacterium]|nr:hypothetical protein [Armatimonadia bacterium]
MGRRCLVVMVVALLALPALGQVRVGEIVFGHEGHYREQHTTQVTIELINDGDRDARGEAYVEVPGQSGAPYLYSQPVDMPAGAHKRVQLYPHVGRTGAVEHFLVGFEPDRGPKRETKVNAQAEEITDIIVLVCTESSPQYNFIRAIDTTTWMSGGSSPGAGASGYSTAYSSADIYVSYTDTAGLPDSWKGLDGVDLLIMADFSSQALSPTQEGAILHWVSTGGHIMVTGGEEYRRVADSFLAPYLPVEVTGTRTFENGLSALVGKFGGRMETAAAAVNDGELVRGYVWSSQSGTPLLTSAQLGVGTVWQTAFSFARKPVLQWDGADDLMSFVLKRGRQYQPGLVELHPEAQVSNALSVHAGPNPPSFQVISLFLVLYIVCLVPVNYLVLKKLDRRELAWITTPAIVILFSVAAYGMGFMLKGSDVKLRTAALFEVQASTGAGQAQSYYALFSPRKTGYDVNFAAERVDARVPPVLNRAYGMGYTEESRLDTPFHVVSGDRDRVEDLVVQMWDQQVFTAQGPVVLDAGMPGDLRLTPRRNLEGTLQNNLGIDLRGCVVAFRGRTLTLGDIAAGDSFSVPMEGVRTAATTEPEPKVPGHVDSGRRSPYGSSYSGGGGISVMAMPTPDVTMSAVYSAMMSGTSPGTPPGLPGAANDPEQLRRDLAEGFLRENVYTPREDEALLFAWTDTDPLGADIGLRGVDKDVVALVVVHIPVYTR